jgi:hypothetical protein
MNLLEQGIVYVLTNPETQETSKNLTRRPNMNFFEMGLQVGDILEFTQADETVTIASEKKVIFQGEETSLTYATRALLTNGTYNVAPSPYWKHNGVSLREIYNDTY